MQHCLDIARQVDGHGSSYRVYLLPDNKTKLNYAPLKKPAASAISLVI